MLLNCVNPFVTRPKKKKRIFVLQYRKITKFFISKIKNLIHQFRVWKSLNLFVWLFHRLICYLSLFHLMHNCFGWREKLFKLCNFMIERERARDGELGRKKHLNGNWKHSNIKMCSIFNKNWWNNLFSFWNSCCCCCCYCCSQDIFVSQDTKKSLFLLSKSWKYVLIRQ